VRLGHVVVPDVVQVLDAAVECHGYVVAADGEGFVVEGLVDVAGELVFFSII
jgi:hypothetical protein